jgi:hypothetical protein
MRRQGLCSSIKWKNVPFFLSIRHDKTACHIHNNGGASAKQILLMPSLITLDRDDFNVLEEKL